LRYDDNKLYASAFSPKIAIQYKVSDRFSLQGSFGRGFKAPDFRQLYLNFTNTAAGSYSVYGALEAKRVIEIQNQQGLIKQLEPDYYRLAELRPEFSNGINGGFTVWPMKSLQWKLNFFRNDIRDLIESRQVAVRQDNSQIFSYINVRKAFTQGFETSLQYQLNKSILFTSGYQFLLTADKEELDKIKQGNYYYTRDDNNHSVLLKRKDYYGLPNRSRHMANFRMSYENQKNWFATARAIFRSKWVVFDKDGNGVYNKQDEFAEGFLLINISAGKSFENGFRIQAGADNLLNYADETNLPNMPGRVIYTSIAYSFIKNKKS
jgi:outer membrane receptor for ferrienterochelin and colicins